MTEFVTITRDNIRRLTSVYRKKTGRSLTAVSKKMYGNSTFLEAFLKGSDERTHGVTLKKLEEMIDAFRADWPDDVAWPACRPLVFRAPRRPSGEKISPKKKRAA